MATAILAYGLGYILSMYIIMKQNVKETDINKLGISEAMRWSLWSWMTVALGLAFLASESTTLKEINNKFKGL